MAFLVTHIGVDTSIVKPEKRVLTSQLLLTHYIHIRHCIYDSVLKSTRMISVRRILLNMYRRASHPEKIFLNLEVLWSLILIGLVI